MSVSSVTKSIVRLETELGAKLLLRTTRRISLTEHGQRFFESCRRVLADLSEAEAEIRDANVKPSGVVKIALPPSFGRLTVVPALPRFFDRYPDIKLAIHFGRQTLDFIDAGYDLVVHSGTLNDSGLISRLLVKDAQKTVASPEYLRRHGTPRTPEDLRSHNCIIGRFGPDWPFADADGRQLTIRVEGNLSTDSGDVLREAAARGLGISQATRWLFRQDLEDGTVVPILEEFEVEADPISVVYPADRHLPAKIRAVIDFLVDLGMDNLDSAPSGRGAPRQRTGRIAVGPARR